MIGKKIALIGNPNSGKTTLFNRLTGLNQRTGNYGGITVDLKVGKLKGTAHQIYDLPGIYSVYPNSADEELVTKILTDPNNDLYPDLCCVVADAANLKRSLLLFFQVRDLGIPAIFVVNMHETAQKRGVVINKEQLEEELGVPVYLIEAKANKGLKDLDWDSGVALIKPFKGFEIPEEYKKVAHELQKDFDLASPYHAWRLMAQSSQYLNDDKRDLVGEIQNKQGITPKRLQVKETLQRYEFADVVLGNSTSTTKTKAYNLSQQIDDVLLNPIGGYIVFFAILLLIFQAIYYWSGVPMDWIDQGFAALAGAVNQALPPGPISGLLTQGVIPGLAGVFIFIPQIAILFFFISLMEESGYMARVVYLMDKWMRPFGLNGKSAVPLMSGVACAIPAILSARNIEHRKERLITMLVTPFITCSARLPIYTILIALVIPSKSFLGIELQAWTLFGLYMLGVLAALGGGWVLKRLLKSTYKSYLVLELPNYRLPRIEDMLPTVFTKTKEFVWGAGKVIFSISILLWALASFSWDQKFYDAESIIQQNISDKDAQEKEKLVASFQLEHSVLGKMGKWIEPAIEPLGYDWKIGIGLISSFAAREVFVGTMATIYSLGGGDADEAIASRMDAERRPDGTKMYSFAAGVSLLLFYVFAMQCMSTLAVMKKETSGWKWPLIQFGFMFVMAYLSALVAYQTLS